MTTIGMDVNDDADDTEFHELDGEAKPSTTPSCAGPPRR